MFYNRRDKVREEADREKRAAQAEADRLAMLKRAEAMRSAALKPTPPTGTAFATAQLYQQEALRRRYEQMTRPELERAVGAEIQAAVRAQDYNGYLPTAWYEGPTVNRTVVDGANLRWEATTTGRFDYGIRGSADYWTAAPLVFADEDAVPDDFNI